MDPSSDAVRDALEALRTKQKAEQEAFEALVQTHKIAWEAEFLLEAETFLKTPFPESVLRAGIQETRNVVWNPGMTIDAGLRAVQQGLTSACVPGLPSLETEKAKFRIDLLQRTYTLLRTNLLAKEEPANILYDALQPPSLESDPVLEIQSKPTESLSRLLHQPGLVHNWKPSSLSYVTYSKYNVLQFFSTKTKPECPYPYWRIPASWNKDTLPFLTTCPTCQKQNRLVFESPVKTTVKSVSCPSGHYEWIASIRKVTPKPPNPYKRMIRRAETTIKTLQDKIKEWKKID